MLHKQVPLDEFYDSIQFCSYSDFVIYKHHCEMIRTDFTMPEGLNCLIATAILFKPHPTLHLSFPPHEINDVMEVFGEIQCLLHGFRQVEIF